MFDIYDFFTYLNAHGKENTYSKIIIYLLTHSEEAASLTISEIAQKCYVSPPTLTRFCRRFGYDSFGGLREGLKVLNRLTPYSSLRMKNTEFQLLQQDPHAYLANYAQEITSAVNDVVATIDPDEIDQLLFKIHQASEVILIGYSATLELARDVQASFLFSKKIFFVGETDDVQEALVDSADTQSLIIVISSYGTLLTKNPELTRKISQSEADSIFITQNTTNTLTNLFTQTIHVTKENYVQIGTYPLTFFFDYLTRRYASLYY